MDNVKSKFKIGDELICIDPYGNSIGQDEVEGEEDRIKKNYAGVGWELDKIGTVVDMTYALSGNSYKDGEPVYWFDNCYGGIYERFLKKAPWSFKEAVKEKMRGQS